MAILASSLEFYLSGGAANSDADLSLGAGIGNALVYQTFTNSVPIPGVTVISVRGLQPSNYDPGAAATINYSAGAGGYLQYEDLDGFLGTSVLVDVSGTYQIPAPTEGGVVVVLVDTVLLPLTDQQTELTNIVTPKNAVYDDIQKTQVDGTYEDYRCLYIRNPVGSGAVAASLEVFVSTGSQQPESPVGYPALADMISLALDPAGIGDGVATGVAIGPLTPQLAPPIPAEQDPNGLLAGLTFTTTDLAVGNLAEGESVAVWIRRAPQGPSIPEFTPDVTGMVCVRTLVG